MQPIVMPARRSTLKLARVNLPHLKHLQSTGNFRASRIWCGKKLSLLLDNPRIILKNFEKFGLIVKKFNLFFLIFDDSWTKYIEKLNSGGGRGMLRILKTARPRSLDHARVHLQNRLIKRLLIFWVILCHGTVLSCKDDIKSETRSVAQSPDTGVQSEKDPTAGSTVGNPELTGLSHVVARAGDKVRVLGKNVDGQSTNLEISVGTVRVALALGPDGISSEFVMPQGVSPGIAVVKLVAKNPAGFGAGQERHFGSVSLISDPGDLPIITLATDTVCQEIKFRNAKGEITTGTKDCSKPTVCSVSGQSDCLAQGTFMAVSQEELLPAVIKTGVTVGGVTGTYPSSGNPLAGADATADLDYASFNAKIKSASTFQWFKSDGTRYTNTGDSDITSSNIASGVGIFDTSGSLVVPNACMNDGEQNCTVAGDFKAANIVSINAWDIRYGLSLAGITGNLKTNCRNSALVSHYNYDGDLSTLPNTAQVFATTNVDVWDSVNDYGGWPSSKVSEWSDGTFCDSSTWSDVTTLDKGSTFVSCGTGGTCIYQDKISKLRVSGPLKSGDYSTVDNSVPASLTWSDAMRACQSSTIGNYDPGTWRLPTQKELQALYTHGIVSIASSSFITKANMDSQFWSSSHGFPNTTATAVVLSYGGTGAQSMTSLKNVVCVQ